MDGHQVDGLCKVAMRAKCREQLAQAQISWVPTRDLLEKVAGENLEKTSGKSLESG